MRLHWGEAVTALHAAILLWLGCDYRPGDVLAGEMVLLGYIEPLPPGQSFPHAVLTALGCEAASAAVRRGLHLRTSEV